MQKTFDLNVPLNRTLTEQNIGVKKIQKMLNNNTQKVEIARIFNVQTATLRRFMHRTNLY